MSTALALSKAPETKWTIQSGSAQGTVRVLLAAQFAIGRSPDCEIAILNDPKCSRKHAVITVMSDSCEVVCLNENNPVLINGQETTRGRLRHGDVLTLGDTEIRLAMSAGASAVAPSGAQLRVAPSPAHAHAHAPAPAARVRRSAPRYKPQGKGGMNRLIIYGVVGLIAYWLFGTSTAKKDAVKIRTEQDIQAEIESATKLKEVAESAKSQRFDGSITARQAQENYIRGFRDYRDGQYERALISFQACLALNPEHPLCNRYLRLSQRKYNEVIQYHMIMGRKYRDQNQYKACRASFRNVMVMVKDASSQIYKEAKANYEACNAFVEGRY